MVSITIPIPYMCIITYRYQKCYFIPTYQLLTHKVYSRVMETLSIDPMIPPLTIIDTHLEQEKRKTFY